MLFIRSLLYFIGSIISGVIISFISLFSYFASHSLRYSIISKWAHFCIWWLRITTNIEIKIEGEENIYKEPCVIVSNHQSTWETMSFQKIFPPHTWVLKKELLWIPVFGWSLAMLNPIAIKRGNKYHSIKKITKQGCARLENGISVVIFPEGSRQPYKKLGKYQSGAFAISKNSKKPIQPVFHNAGKYWPKNSFLKKAGVITVVIGKPIYAKNTSEKDITKKIRDWTYEQSQRIS